MFLRFFVILASFIFIPSAKAYDRWLHDLNYIGRQVIPDEVESVLDGNKLQENQFKVPEWQVLKVLIAGGELTIFDQMREASEIWKPFFFKEYENSVIKDKNYLDKAFPKQVKVLRKYGFTDGQLLIGMHYFLNKKNLDVLERVVNRKALNYEPGFNIFKQAHYDNTIISYAYADVYLNGLAEVTLPRIFAAMQDIDIFLDLRKADHSPALTSLRITHDSKFVEPFCIKDFYRDLYEITFDNNNGLKREKKDRETFDAFVQTLFNLKKQEWRQQYGYALSVLSSALIYGWVDEQQHCLVSSMPTALIKNFIADKKASKLSSRGHYRLSNVLKGKYNPKSFRVVTRALEFLKGRRSFSTTRGNVEEKPSDAFSHWLSSKNEIDRTLMPNLVNRTLGKNKLESGNFSDLEWDVLRVFTAGSEYALLNEHRNVNNELVKQQLAEYEKQRISPIANEEELAKSFPELVTVFAKHGFSRNQLPITLRFHMEQMRFDSIDTNEAPPMIRNWFQDFKMHHDIEVSKAYECVTEYLVKKETSSEFLLLPAFPDLVPFGCVRPLGFDEFWSDMQKASFHMTLNTITKYKALNTFSKALWHLKKHTEKGNKLTTYVKSKVPMVIVKGVKFFK